MNLDYLGFLDRDIAAILLIALALLRDSNSAYGSFVGIKIAWLRVVDY